ncbi:MAG: FAD:protein FMN transferase [Planctomycetes bacterium]|nr:FAD:protein FMN transferase [Planctomycetota bacterium]
MTSDSLLVHRARPAMGTLFEIWLRGDDEEHLTSVAEAALDEVARLEQLLSRFDARSEISRVNRTAAQEPVQIDRELFALLEVCQQAWQASDGAFEITAGSSAGVMMTDVALDAGAQTVRFARDGVRLDLGAVGKGYALDWAAAVLDQFGVFNALIHGGTSSVLARGTGTGGAAWLVDIRWPPGQADAPRVTELALRDMCLSTSAAFGDDTAISDVIDPRTGRPLDRQAACVVVAPSATEAEIWSTALLCMGKAATADYTEAELPAGVFAGWIEPDNGDATAKLTWLKPLS